MGYTTPLILADSAAHWLKFMWGVQVNPIGRSMLRVAGAVLLCSTTGFLLRAEPSLGLGDPAAQQTPAADQNVIAVVFPADAQPGDTITGTVTDNPREIAGLQQIPGLRVMLYPVVTSAPSSATSNVLEGMVVEVNGEKQPTGQPFVTKVGADAAAISFSVHPADASRPPIAQGDVAVASPGFRRSSLGTSAVACDMNPISAPGSVEVIHGPSTGDARQMHITVDGKPARIIAATPRSVFWEVPRDLSPASPADASAGGAHTVVYSRIVGGASGDTPQRVTFLLYLLQMKMWADNTNLRIGQSTTIHYTLTLDGVPDKVWRSAMPSPDLVDLEALKTRMKGLKLPKPDEPGTVVLLIENYSPNVVHIGEQNVIALQLHQNDFPYTGSANMQSLHRGSFLILGRVSAFVTSTQEQTEDVEKQKPPQEPDNSERKTAERMAERPRGNPPGTEVNPPVAGGPPQTTAKGPCPCKELCAAAVSAEASAQGALDDYEMDQSLVDTTEHLLDSLRKGYQQDLDLAAKYDTMGHYEAEAARLRKDAEDAQKNIEEEQRILAEEKKRLDADAEKYNAAATKAAYARQKCDECLAEHPECPDTPLKASGIPGHITGDSEGPYTHVPGDPHAPAPEEPKIPVPPTTPGGGHDIYGHDKVEDCPERHRGCIALIVDFMRNDPTTNYFREEEKKVRERIAHPKSQDEKRMDESMLKWLPKPTDLEGKLRSAGCGKVDHEEPDLWPFPKPIVVDIGNGVQVTVFTPTPEINDMVRAHNNTEKQRLDAAIARHRVDVSTSKPEIAMEIIDAHGGGAYDTRGLLPSFDSDYRCGDVGPGYYAGPDLYRGDFHDGNYHAANKNVCGWFTMDFSCYGGLTPKVTDELNNLATSSCRAASTVNCGNHAGWEADGSMASATAVSSCRFGTAYSQAAVFGDLLDRQAARDGSGSDFSSFMSDVRRMLRAGTAFYTDRGYAKDQPPIHSHFGYPTTARPATCTGGMCGR